MQFIIDNTISFKMAEPQSLQPEQNTKIEEESKQKPQQFVDQVKIDGETVFTISPEMLMEQDNLPKQRKTRWGQFKIKKQQVQQDVIFNPLQALVSGNSLMAITQYGQSQLQLKMAIFGDPSSRRKSKWHHEIQKTFTPPMMDYISPQIGLDEIQYLIRLYRLDEISCKMNDFQPEDLDVRSPSPEPIYNQNGVRVNTRQTRRKQALLKQKVQLIQDCMKMRKSFVPPKDYKPLRKMKRIYLTESALNDTHANYLGKIIGRKGETQKRIQQITGCSISLRGKGINSASKDPYDSYEKPHVLITADTNEQIELGVQQIQKILNTEGNDQLPVGEGIVGIVEGMFDKGYCENCQQTGHRTWQCPDAPHIRNIVKCNICGQNSHPTSDCPQKAEYQKAQHSQQINKLMESQYSKFKGVLEGQKPKQASFSFITDFNKKDMLKLQAQKQVLPSTNINPPASLGGFTMPLNVPNPSLPSFEKKVTAIPNFVLPKFESEKKDGKDNKGSN